MKVPSRVLTALGLALDLAAQIVASGLTTAWIIVAPKARPRAGIVEISYSGLSEVGATVLASMIAVTPGTTPVDIDHLRGVMKVHFLDLSGAEASIRSIRRRYEARLQALLPEKKRGDRE